MYSNASEVECITPVLFVSSEHAWIVLSVYTADTSVSKPHIVMICEIAEMSTLSDHFCEYTKMRDLVNYNVIILSKIFKHYFHEFVGIH